MPTNAFLKWFLLDGKTCMTINESFDEHILQFRLGCLCIQKFTISRLPIYSMLT
uniref:Uncharacterized protein n=1 Tax=Ascaris lumbricoides TaxID=6252 RepID=A0A0M3ICS0_ASCLU